MDVKLHNEIIIALRNEKGSYNISKRPYASITIIALRNEKGSYNIGIMFVKSNAIIALRNEKGSYPFLRRNKKCGKKQHCFLPHFFIPTKL